jgi:5'(3')-deoxyribonucleotidase
MARILLDVDGVVADYVARYLQVVQHVTGRCFAEQDVTQWNIAAALGLTDQEESRVHEITARPGFCSDLVPYPGARAAVQQLARQHTIVWLTTPSESSPTWRQDRRLWLVRHFGKLGDTVVQTHQKQTVAGDLLVDDRVDNCIRWARVHPSGRAVLWTRPWNAAAQPPGVWRASNWNVIERIACEVDAARPG